MELEKAEAMGASCFAVDFVQGDQVPGWEAGLVESGRGVQGVAVGAGDGVGGVAYL